MPKRNGLKEAPRPGSDTEEQAYWDEHDLVDHVDWPKAEVAVFPNLRPPTETVSLRLPLGLSAELRRPASERDFTCPSRLKVYPGERLGRERTQERRREPNKRMPPPAGQARRDCYAAWAVVSTAGGRP